MLPGHMCGWTIREHCAQLFQGYRVQQTYPPDGPRQSWTRTTEKDLSALSMKLACTRHVDVLKIENNGNEPWKRLCSNVGPALDDDDDDDNNNDIKDNDYNDIK